MLNIKSLDKSLKLTYGRKHIVNFDLSSRILKESGLKSEYGSDLTIIDAYPGPGVFSSALNNYLNPKKHILIEPVPKFRKLYEKFENKSVATDSRDPFRWQTFLDIFKNKSLIEDPTKLNTNNLLYTCNLTNLQGEQLVNQYLNCVMNQNWIQKYGRIKMLLLLEKSTVLKLLAEKNEKARNRTSVQCQTFTDSKILYDNFDSQKDIWKYKVKSVPENNKLVLLQMNPVEPPVPMELLDSYEYVIKNLFILKTKPLSECISVLGPGANIDLASQLSPEILEKSPSELELNDFIHIADLFDKWPFKPDILHDFYEESAIIEQ